MAPVTFFPSGKNSEKIKDKLCYFPVAMTDLKEYKQKISGEVLFISGTSRDKVVQAEYSNGLVGCLFNAYNNHNEIMLRPEDFWCAVMTQFSAYVNANGEELRSKFVDFEGKKLLKVEGLGNMRTVPYDQMTIQMTEEISKNIKDQSLRDWILPNFTTTESKDKVVFSAIMMSSMQKYFDYKMCCMCGIPAVTLRGTPEDYIKLKEKVTRLAEFDLNGIMVKWLALLTPIFDQLIQASQGQPDLDFWNKVVQNISGGSGPSYISGWLSAFCCFNEDGKWMGDELSVKFYYGKEVKSDYPIIDTNDIPSGIVSVPITIVDIDRKEYQSRMIAGSCLANLFTDRTYEPRLDFMLALIDESKHEKKAKSFW